MDYFTAKEISKKYGHTFCNVYLKNIKEILPVYFERFNIAEGIPSTVLVSYAHFDKDPRNKVLGNFKNKQTTLSLSDFKILDLPYRKVFDCNGMTRVFSRNPQRQWQKGICNGNSSFESPVGAIYTSMNSRKYYLQDDRFRTSVGSLNNLLTDNFAGSLYNAIEDIDKYKLLSRSISEKYFISLFPDEDKQYVLFRYSIPTAFYNKDKDSFKLINELYRQELNDFCRRNNLYSMIGI